MKQLTLALICIGAFLLAARALPQERRPNFPTPPEAADPSARATHPEEPKTKRFDIVQLERDANELARTAQTIPADVENVRKGMLPKDVVQKLKQIEKLSKRLRSELNP